VKVEGYQGSSASRTYGNGIIIIIIILQGIGHSHPVPVENFPNL
jgi:hypothetical protein